MTNLIEQFTAKPGYYGALLGVSFCAGAAAYFLAGKVKEKIDERKAEKERSDDFEPLFDEGFAGYDDGSGQSRDVSSQAFQEMERVIAENYAKPDITDYTKFFQNSYEGEHVEAPSDGEDSPNEDAPNCSIVGEEDYMATDIPGYAKADGTYFVKDKILAGWNDKLTKQDIDSTIGREAVLKLEDPDISTVYVRNATIKVDYQITKSDASYEEAVAEADI